MTAPPWLASLIANPRRSLLGIAALCTGLAPLVADAGPAWTKGLHGAAIVAAAMAAMMSSADDKPPGAT